MLNMYREYSVALKMLMGEHQDRIQAFGEGKAQIVSSLYIMKLSTYLFAILV